MLFKSLGSRRSELHRTNKRNGFSKANDRCWVEQEAVTGSKRKRRVKEKRNVDWTYVCMCANGADSVCMWGDFVRMQEQTSMQKIMWNVLLRTNIMCTLCAAIHSKADNKKGEINKRRRRPQQRERKMWIIARWRVCRGVFSFSQPMCIQFG